MRDWSSFLEKYQRVPRILREQVMCSMIRINYGTPWAGDVELLKPFFPVEMHSALSFGGLTELVHNLSPFANEPTNHEPLPRDHAEKSLTVLDGEKTELRGDDAPTASRKISTKKFDITQTLKSFLT